MIYWIKRIARIVSLLAFLIIFFVSYSNSGFEIASLPVSLLKGMGAGFVFWFIGFIIADIILKGAVETIPEDNLEEEEGGLVARTKEAARRNSLSIKLKDQRSKQGDTEKKQEKKKKGKDEKNEKNE